MENTINNAAHAIFSIDFEATQFTNEIISIGCVAENGAKFQCYVIPSDIKKITNFITNLTGITRGTVLEEGFPPDEAFLRMRDWVSTQLILMGKKMPVYYCYGGNDVEFIQNTIKKMECFDSINYAGSVKAFLVDYSQTVKQYLSATGIALRKLVTLVRHEEVLVEQDHDSLHDAEMLLECIGHLDKIAPNDEYTQNVLSLPSRNRSAKDPLFAFGEELESKQIGNLNFPPEKIAYLAELRRAWSDLKESTIFGDADEEHPAKIKLTNLRNGDIKLFSMPEAAATFLNMKVKTGATSRKMEKIAKCVREMYKNPNNYCHYRIEDIKESEEK